MIHWPYALVTWYRGVKRDLPWRRTKDPYAIWVSEIMLQQTRVEAVMGYYTRFMAAFPTIAELAYADEDAVLKLWEGLGYYSRAKNLQRAARVVSERYGGIFPSEYEAVRALPGIGDYTAGAILSIAFDKPYPAVDGNVAPSDGKTVWHPTGHSVAKDENSDNGYPNGMLSQRLS
ncbi:MAG: A/G-specific adenine glycosylase [Clostridia bacterium]